MKRNNRHHGIPARVAVGMGFVALDVISDSTKNGGYIALGGSAGNVLAILGYFGWTAVPVSKLGNDRAATLIRREFARVRADIEFIDTDGTNRTPIVYQFSEHGRHRFSFVCPYCGRKHGYVENEQRDLADRVLRMRQHANVFYFDRVSKVIVRAAEEYRRRGALVMFEPSTLDADHELFARALRTCHMVKYASDRIRDLEGFDLRSVGVEIQTKGERGLMFRGPSLAGDWLALPSFLMPHVTDTAGAGDWSSAAMLYYLFEYESFEHPEALTPTSLHNSLRFGQALAALNCLYGGARGLSHRWSSLFAIRSARSLMRARSNVNQRHLTHEYWRSDPGPALFEHVVRGSSASRSDKNRRQLKDLCCQALAL